MHRKTYGQTNKNDFIGPIPQRWRFDHILPKFENNSFKIIWLDCGSNAKNQYKKKKCNQHSSMFRVQKQ